MESFVIRQAIEADRAGIARVFAEAFYEDWKMLSTNLSDIAQALAKGIALKNYAVAVVEDEVVAFLACVTGDSRAFYVPVKEFQRAFGFFKGYMGAMMIQNEFEKSQCLDVETAYIDIIGVQSQYRKRGIATELIAHCIARSDCRAFVLSVTDVNAPAIACYQKFGFREFKREKVKYARQRGFSEYVFMKFEKR